MREIWGAFPTSEARKDCGEWSCVCMGLTTWWTGALTQITEHKQYIDRNDLGRAEIWSWKRDL